MAYPFSLKRSRRSRVVESLEEDYLRFSESATPPALAPQTGTLYFDDGTNTDSGQPGFRYALDESTYVEMPFYQTSTYTPTVGDGTNIFTLSSATGVWYRVGSMLTTQASVAWTSKGSVTGAVVILNVTPYSIDTSIINRTIGQVFGAGIIPDAGYNLFTRKATGPNLNFVMAQTPYTSTTSLKNAVPANFHTAGTLYVTCTFPVSATPV